MKNQQNINNLNQPVKNNNMQLNKCYAGMGELQQKLYINIFYYFNKQEKIIVDAEKNPEEILYYLLLPIGKE